VLQGATAILRPCSTSKNLHCRVRYEFKLFKPFKLFKLFGHIVKDVRRPDVAVSLISASAMLPP
jgi:hypothetical protein